MINFETPQGDYNRETGKWDWEPGIFWKRNANNGRIVTADVCPEQLANRTPEQECQDLLDIFAQALHSGFLLNEYHFDTTLELIRARVLELDTEKGEIRLNALTEMKASFDQIVSGNKRKK